MTSSQKIVAIGAGSGVISMVGLVSLLYYFLPAANGIITLSDKLAYTLALNAFAVLPFFIMLISVGNARFLSEAINPLANAESDAIKINGRVANNTLEQTFVFVIGTLALSTFLSPAQMSLIAALTIVFVLARTIFWIGYRINPLYRAPGMAATSYMNLGIILSVIYFFFF